MKPNLVAQKSVMSVISFWSIVSCILIIPIFILIFKIIALKKYRIEFYDDKIITYSGLINTSKTQCVFMGVTASNVKQSLFGRILNYGDVFVDCVGKWDVDTTYIKNPQQLDEYLQTKIVQATPQATTLNQFVHI